MKRISLLKVVPLDHPDMKTASMNPDTQRFSLKVSRLTPVDPKIVEKVRMQPILPS